MKELQNVLVVKVGTNTLIKKQADGLERLDMASFRRIGQQVLGLQKQNTQTALVSSGAITAGMVATGCESRPSKQTRDGMVALQRLASIGWRHILNAWDDALDAATTGGVLLTRHELNLASERDELLHVTHSMLSRGDVVIANENDVIAHEQIAFGDNDTLAATYAAQMNRSGLFGTVGLVILSDVHGLYRDKHDARTLIRTVDDIASYRHLAGGAGSANGTGGMKTKFDAARIATEAGVTMWIANGRTDDAIQFALQGKIGTEFTCATQQNQALLEAVR